MRREYDNLKEMRDCSYIVQLLKGREKRIGRNDLQLDLMFEYCPYDLKKIIQKTSIRFKFEEIKSFLRQILVGLAYMHKHLVGSVFDIGFFPFNLFELFYKCEFSHISSAS